MRVWLISILVLIAGAGCSRPALHVKVAGPPVLPSGWTLATDPDSGVSLGVASGWREGVDKALDPMGAASGVASDVTAQQSTDPNNALGQMVSQMDQMEKEQEAKALADLKAKGIVIQVLDGSRPTIGEERTRYYVKRVDHGSNYSLDLAGQDEKDHLLGMGADSPTTVQLPIGPALKFVAERKTIAGDETNHVSYVVVDGKYSYHLRFGSTNNPSAIQSIADQVAQTWRITPSKP